MKIRNPEFKRLLVILLLSALFLPGSGLAETKPVTRYVNVRVDSSLNVRELANAKSDAVGSLARGNLVTVLDTAGDWCEISHDRLTGWVCAEFLSETFPPMPLGGAYTVTASPSVNVRDYPKGSLVCRLKTDATVYVFERAIDEDGVEWSKLDEGWVKSEYITEADDDE